MIRKGAAFITLLLMMACWIGEGEVSGAAGGRVHAHGRVQRIWACGVRIW